MSPFLKHAEEIFEVARQGGREDCELAILVGRDGGIHVVPAEDWGLEPLRLHHGAAAAYRVRRAGGRVTLEARSSAEACRLEASHPAGVMRTVLADRPRYLTVL